MAKQVTLTNLEDAMIRAKQYVDDQATADVIRTTTTLWSGVQTYPATVNTPVSTHVISANLSYRTMYGETNGGITLSNRLDNYDEIEVGIRRVVVSSGHQTIQHNTAYLFPTSDILDVANNRYPITLFEWYGDVFSETDKAFVYFGCQDHNKLGVAVNLGNTSDQWDITYVKGIKYATGGGSDEFIVDTSNPPSSNEFMAALSDGKIVRIKHTDGGNTRYYDCVYAYDTEGTTFNAYTLAIPHNFADRMVIRNFWFSHEDMEYDVPMTFDRVADSPVGADMDVTSTINTKNGSVSFNDDAGNRFSMMRSDATNGMVRTIFNKTQSGQQVPVINNLITEDYLGSLVSPNGTKYKLKVSDNGTLSTEVA